MILPRAKYREDEQRGKFFKQLVERVRSLPGVQAASATATLPLGGGSWVRSITVEGYPVLSVGQAQIIQHAQLIQHTVVTPGSDRDLWRDGLPRSDSNT